MPELRFDSITKRYGEVTAVNSLSLTVKAGEFFVLLGPSGAGKSSLVSCLTGFISPDSGTITIGDKQVEGPGVSVVPRDRGISAVSQEGGLWPHMTVRKHLEFVLSGRLERHEVQARVVKYLTMVRLDDKQSRFPHELSGGERQRLSLARSLCVENPLLLLDEPFANLDRPLVLELIADVNRLHRELGLTTLLITHQQEDALFVADRMGVMCNGGIIQCSLPADIYFKPANRFVAGFFGDNNILPSQSTDGKVTTPLGEVKDAGGPEGPCWLCVRPSAISVVKAGEGIPATVESTVFKGEFWLARLSLATGESLLANIGTTPLSPGPCGIRLTGPHALVRE